MIVGDDGVHVDEGTIHAWLDGELDEVQAARLQAHIGRCGACAAHVAEARGLMAGASRVVRMLDETPSPVVRPAVSPSTGSTLSAWRLLRVTPARASIAAILVVAVGIALTRGQFAREPVAELSEKRAALQVQSAASVLSSTRTTDTVLGSAIARRLAAEQPPRQLVPAPDVGVAAAPPPPAPVPNADLADAGSRIATGRASMAEQRLTSAAGADRTRAGVGQLAQGKAVAAQRAGVAANAADMVATAPASANQVAAYAGIAAGECYRVESSVPAVWGGVRLPMIVAVDSTGVEARILSPSGTDTEARAYLQHNGADSALFRLRRIGFDGSMTLLPSSGTRTGVLQSSRMQVATEPTPAPSAPARRAVVPSATRPNASAGTPAAITARRVACPSQAP